MVERLQGSETPKRSSTQEQLDKLKNDAQYAKNKATERAGQAKQLNRSANFRVRYFDNLAKNAKDEKEAARYKNLALRSRGIASEYKPLDDNAYRTEKAISAQQEALNHAKDLKTAQSKAKSIQQISSGEGKKEKNARDRAIGKSAFLRGKNIAPESAVVRTEFSKLSKDVQEQIKTSETERSEVKNAQRAIVENTEVIESGIAQKEAIIYRAQNPDFEAKLQVGGQEYIIDPDTGVIHTKDGKQVTSESTLQKVDEEMAKKTAEAETEGNEAYMQWANLLKNVDEDILDGTIRNKVQAMILKMHSPFLTAVQRADLEKEYQDFSRKMRISTSNLMSSRLNQKAENIKDQAEYELRAAAGRAAFELAMTIFPFGRAAKLFRLDKGAMAISEFVFAKAPVPIQKLMLKASEQALKPREAVPLFNWIKQSNIGQYVGVHGKVISGAAKNFTEKNATKAGEAIANSMTAQRARVAKEMAKEFAGKGKRVADATKVLGNKVAEKGKNKILGSNLTDDAVLSFFKKVDAPEFAAIKSEAETLQTALEAATLQGKKFEAITLEKQVAKLHKKFPELKIANMDAVERKAAERYWRNKNFLEKNPDAKDYLIKGAEKAVEENKAAGMKLLAEDFHLTAREVRSKLKLPKYIDDLYELGDESVLGKAASRLKAIESDIVASANKPAELRKLMAERKTLNEKYARLIPFTEASSGARASLQQYLRLEQRLTRAKKLADTTAISNITKEMDAIQKSTSELPGLLKALGKSDGVHTGDNIVQFTTGSGATTDYISSKLAS